MNIFIETDRVIITKPELTDCDHIFNLETDALVMQYIDIDPTSHTKENILTILKKLKLHHEQFGFSVGSVFDKESGQFIGRAGLLKFSHPETPPTVELGCTLLKTAWNQGYATEIASTLIHWAFANLDIDRLIALTHPNNKTAQHILRKLEMVYEKNIMCGKMENALYVIYKS